MSQAAIETVRQLRDELYRIRTEKPGTGYAHDAYIRYMREASRLGLNPTALREDSKDETERFFARTVPGPDGHVYWTGAKGGFKRNDGGVRTPARWWWEHVHGPIGTTTYRTYPTCGDKACINPEHIELRHYRPERYSENFCIGALQVYVMRHGHAPSSDGWDRAGLKPTSGAFVLKFGSWNKALRAAGIEPRRQGGQAYTEKSCLDAIRFLHSKLGHWPDSTEFDSGREALRAAGLPTSRMTIRNKLGKNWDEVIAKAKAA